MGHHTATGWELGASLGPRGQKVLFVESMVILGLSIVSCVLVLVVLNWPRLRKVHKLDRTRRDKETRVFLDFIVSISCSESVGMIKYHIDLNKDVGPGTIIPLHLAGVDHSMHHLPLLSPVWLLLSRTSGQCTTGLRFISVSELVGWEYHQLSTPSLKSPRVTRENAAAPAILPGGGLPDLCCRHSGNYTKTVYSRCGMDSHQ